MGPGTPYHYLGGRRRHGPSGGTLTPRPAREERAPARLGGVGSGGGSSRAEMWRMVQSAMRRLELMRLERLVQEDEAGIEGGLGSGDDLPSYSVTP